MMYRATIWLALVLLTVSTSVITWGLIEGDLPVIVWAIIPFCILSFIFLKERL